MAVPHTTTSEALCGSFQAFQDSQREMQDSAAELFFLQAGLQRSGSDRLGSSSSIPTNHKDEDDALLDALLADDTEVINYYTEDRFVDFFCIVGQTKQHCAAMLTKAEKEGNTQNRIPFIPSLLDRYPKARPDVEFPGHLPAFCFPNGCEALRRKVPKGNRNTRTSSSMAHNIPEPALCHIVLTSGMGQRLYVTTLTVYEQFMRWRPQEESKKSTTCPGEPPYKRSKSNDSVRVDEDYCYWIPKCLVLLGRHPSFHAQSTILKELYYTVQYGTSPVPLERYIAHIIHDIPRPTPKRIVEWRSWTGPGVNDTPVTFRLEHNVFAFSLEPLFRTLSLSTILVLWATLLKEGKVVLSCSSSQNSALLTPISQALLSLLFPLEWEGMYIPILPNDNQQGNHLDILDCPVPYLVGLVVGESTHLPSYPVGVVWCDLETDTLHLGWNDDGTAVKELPALPESASLRLKTQLEEVADPLYLPTADGVKARMTVADRNTELDNFWREAYAHQTRALSMRFLTCQAYSRTYILSQASKIPPRGKPLRAEDFVLSTSYHDTSTRYSSKGAPKKPTKPLTQEEPTSPGSAFMTSMIRQGRSMQVQADRFLAAVGQQKFASPSKYATKNGGRDLAQDALSRQDEIAASFFDLTDADQEMAKKVQGCFGEFFASVLFRYDFYVDPETNRLNTDRFVRSLKLPRRQQDFVQTVVASQMFERFLTDKKRRKAFNVLLARRKKGTSKPRKPPSVMVPPPPLGVGIRKGQVYYQQRRFPESLNEEECISSTTPSPSVWDSLCQGPLCSVFELW